MTKPKKKIRRTRTDVSKLTLTDNIPKGGGLKIDAKAFVQIFRKQIEKSLLELGMKKAGLTENGAPSMEDNTPKPDKETIIKDLMEGSNYTRQQAEVAAAIELGETNGDIIELDNK